MGCASLSISVTELIELGARLLLRVGTAGSVAPDVVRAGSLVIATACVRDEGASDRYVARDYPAVGNHDWVTALRRAALRLGRGDRTFMGVVHAKDALYAVEFGHGPLGATNHEYMRRLRQMRVLASDMETSHLFVLSDVHSSGIVPISQPAGSTDVVRSGSLLAVVGDDSPYAQPEVARQAEEDAIRVAVEAALELLAGSAREGA
jgi:uridine phosphorylase